MTVTSESIPYGTWYVREIEQPAGFVLDDTIYLHVQPCDTGWDYTLYAKVKYNRPDELVRSMSGAFASWEAV